MTEFEDIGKLLATATLPGGVEDEVIRAAEVKLGVQFPPSYRLFLSRYGAALCAGFEIAGLFYAGNDDEGPPLWSDVVAATLQRRRQSDGLIPDSYVPVSDDGGDYTFYLDTTCSESQGECPVVVLGPGADGVIVAEDFFEFLVRSFEGSLSF